MRKIILLPLFFCFALFLGYWGLYFGLRMNVPPYQLRYVEAIPTGENDKVVPFYGVMSPLFNHKDYYVVPKLLYKKGPPERFINKFGLSYIHRQRPSERLDIVYYGRRSHKDKSMFVARHLFRGIEDDYGNLLKASLEYSYNEIWPAYLESKEWMRPFARLFLLWHARDVIAENNFRHVYLMNHSGASSFLLDHGRRNYTVWFFRKSKKYQIKLAMSKKGIDLSARDFFQKSFLLNSRSDAIAWVGEKLSDVKMKKQESYAIDELVWPLSLLIAKVSVEPSSINAYFHFAGLNTILFKSLNQAANSPMEVVDEIRNNVLSASRYGKDIAPESRQTNEMSRFARTLVDTF